MRSRLILIFTFSVFNILCVKAQTDPCQRTALNTLDTPLAYDIQRVAGRALEINNWSADRENIRQSPCRPDVPNISDMERMYLESFDSPKSNKIIGGVHFQDEPRDLLLAFEDLLSERDHFNAITNQKNIQNEIPSDCQKIKCATEAVFGKELGHKLLYLKTYGFNSSEYAFENRSRLTNREADVFIRSSQSFPQDFFPIDPNKQLTKFLRGNTLKMHNPSVVAFAAITFYDRWSEYNDEMMEYTAIHEMAHYIASEYNLDETPEWMELSGWEDHGDPQGRENFEASKDHTFCSHYGSTNPGEDFAESVSAYRFNPSLLKAASLEKYQFIKEHVFAGVEFTHEEECRASELLNEMQEELEEIIKNPDNVDYDQLIAKCAEQSYSYILSAPSSKDSFESCISSNFNNSEINQVVEQHIESHTPPYTNPDAAKKMIFNNLKNRLSSQSVPPEEMRQIKEHLKDKFTDKMFTGNSYSGNSSAPSQVSKFLNRLTNSSPPGYEKLNEVCNERWDEYSNQYLNIFDDKEKYEDAYYASFSNRSQLQIYAFSLCSKSQYKNGHITREEIQESLSHIQ